MTTAAALKQQPAENSVRQRFAEVLLEKIVETNPRTGPDPDLEDLASNIKLRGLIAPISVRHPDNKGEYEILSGRRRLAAVRMLAARMQWRNAKGEQVNTIPAVIRFESPLGAKLTEISENLFRQDLDPLDEAEQFRQYGELKQVRSASGIARSLNEDLGRCSEFHQRYVARSLALLLLPADIRADYFQLKQECLQKYHQFKLRKTQLEELTKKPVGEEQTRLWKQMKISLVRELEKAEGRALRKDQITGQDIPPADKPSAPHPADHAAGEKEENCEAPAATLPAIPFKPGPVPAPAFWADTPLQEPEQETAIAEQLPLAPDPPPSGVIQYGPLKAKDPAPEESAPDEAAPQMVMAQAPELPEKVFSPKQAAPPASVAGPAGTEEEPQEIVEAVAPPLKPVGQKPATAIDPAIEGRSPSGTREGAGEEEPMIDLDASLPDIADYFGYIHQKLAGFNAAGYTPEDRSRVLRQLELLRMNCFDISYTISHISRTLQLAQDEIVAEYMERKAEAAGEEQPAMALGVETVTGSRVEAEEINVSCNTYSAFHRQRIQRMRAAADAGDTEMQLRLAEYESRFLNQYETTLLLKRQDPEVYDEPFEVWLCERFEEERTSGI